MRSWVDSSPSTPTYPSIMTAGCFDWTHAGHESLITFCKERCDRLIVIVHDDDAIRFLKKTTCVQPLNERLRNVRFLGADEIIVVKGTCCREAVNEWRRTNGSPSVFVRGDDNPDFPNRAYFEVFTKVRLTTYSRNVSSTQLRTLTGPNAPSALRRLMLKLSTVEDEETVFFIDGHQAKEVWERRLPTSPLIFKTVVGQAENNSMFTKVLINGSIVRLLLPSLLEPNASRRPTETPQSRKTELQ